MKHPYTRLLRDEELRFHLAAGDTIAFVGLASKWKYLERQVERLGFGDSYAVTVAKKRTGDSGFIRVSPVKSGADQRVASSNSALAST
jgi:hypothetical protein